MQGTIVKEFLDPGSWLHNSSTQDYQAQKRLQCSPDVAKVEAFPEATREWEWELGLAGIQMSQLIETTPLGFSRDQNERKGRWESDASMPLGEVQ